MLNSAEIDSILDEILATPDVGEIFVRAFRWAQRNRRYVLTEHSLLEKSARQEEPWHDLQSEIAGMLRNGALSRMRSHPDPEKRTHLPAELSAWLRRKLWTKLVNAPDRQVFPVVLALMDAVDRELYPLLWEDFWRRGEGRETAPVHGDRPFPKPVAALGPRDISEQCRQSERGELPEYLELEQYFGWLSVPTRRECILPSGLHPRSRRGDGARPWRVAVLSLLAGLDELDWQKPPRRFWASEFSSPGVREAVRGRLLWAMRHCGAHEADLILIPELNVDGEIHDLLLDLLAEMRREPGSLHPMVIAGRLHESARDEPDAYLNRPVVLTPDGPLAWPYHKVAVAAWRDRQEGQQGWDRKEALSGQPSEVVAIDTPMGRIAIAMCLDFLTNRVVESIVDLRASVVVVLSMTSTGSINLFQHKAAELAASTHAITLFCNSSVLLQPPSRSRSGPCTLGFAYPHTTGVPRPICEHELRDARTVATVAVYVLEYCSVAGVKGTVLLDEALPEVPLEGQAFPFKSIGGESANAPAAEEPSAAEERSAAD